MAAKRDFTPTSLRTRTTCRICGSPHLAPVLDLGEQCIAGAFADPGGERPVERTIPVELVRCDMTADQDACGPLQLPTPSRGVEILYQSYWYRSGVMELHRMPLMLDRNAFDVIVHEHLECYSLAVIERLLAQAGLEVVRSELNEVNGCSIGCSSATRAGSLSHRRRGRASRSPGSTSSRWRSMGPGHTPHSPTAPSKCATS